jgi:hypothetical protein
VGWQVRDVAGHVVGQLIDTVTGVAGTRIPDEQAAEMREHAPSLLAAQMQGSARRQGVMVAHRTLHRFCVERTDYQGRGRRGTVPVLDGKPGAECQIDFARMGMIFDCEAWRRRVAHGCLWAG